MEWNIEYWKTKYWLPRVDTERKSIHWFWEWCPNLHFSLQDCNKWWPNIIIKESKQTIHYNYFCFLIIMFMLCCWFDKKLQLRLMVVSVSLKIKFEHAQIIVPKSVYQYQTLTTQLRNSVNKIMNCQPILHLLKTVVYSVFLKKIWLF